MLAHTPRSSPSTVFNHIYNRSPPKIIIIIIIISHQVHHHTTISDNLNMNMDNNSAPPEQAVAAAAAPQKPSMNPPIPTFFKYSKRVLLRDVINNGPDFVGQRVVVGGWVKSSREIKTEAPSTTTTTNPSNQMIVHQQPNKDFDCVEILQTKLPFFRSFLKVFGMAHNYPVRNKLESHNNIPKLPQQPSLAMLQISDGSSVASLQVLVESSVSPTSQVMATGTCILVDGLLQQASSTKKDGAGKHAIELKVIRVLHIGTVDQDTYPLSKKKLPLHLLRDSAHFRPRTTTVGSVARIRSALNEGTHNFFQTNGFLFVQVPIITATDCEGSSSQKFQVVTRSADVNGDVEEEEEEEGNYRTTARGDDRFIISLESIKASIEEKSKQLDELKRSDSNREAVVAATKDLHKTNEIAAELELELNRTKKIKMQKQKQKQKQQYLSSCEENFFGRQAYLTVSGRLHLQSYACALGNVYSCGPRFRGGPEEEDNKGKLRRGRGGLSESWMSEVEIAFSELEDAIKCAEDLVKHVSKWAVENCMEDLKFLGKRVDARIVDRLKSNIISPLKRMTYTEAVEVLKEEKKDQQESSSSSSCKVEWGRALTEEDESCLAEEIYKQGVVIYNHPKQVKPFYMRLNEDGKTVASFDIIMPKGGRVISGGENEERNGVVKERIKELGRRPGMSSSEYEWYLDLTRHGCVKSSGFSMHFDLLSIHATGLIDLRDAIPFSRTPLQPLNN
ncbi:asparagine--tRNA ligase-like [Impatiens glandulifera]|uniref:asparagine--tRNA ligase-like n=1 Tax=Impatiens glandulifera TaxID=253017 RepID=UPI001FB188EE|nr:asparagine--tRNA ligase-like [Impatiens glandulifera]